MDNLTSSNYHFTMNGWHPGKKEPIKDKLIFTATRAEKNILFTKDLRRRTTNRDRLRVGSIWSRPKAISIYLVIAPGQSYNLTTGATIRHYARNLQVNIHEAKLIIGDNND